jgi:membrane protein YdbS with pleckstrin-like domain
VRNSYTSRQEKEGADRSASRNFRLAQWRSFMSISLILLIVVILLLVGALPSWGYSSGWGYWPSGGLGLVLLILIILMVMGRI